MLQNVLFQINVDPNPNPNPNPEKIIKVTKNIKQHSCF